MLRAQNELVYLHNLVGLVAKDLAEDVVEPRALLDELGVVSRDNNEAVRSCVHDYCPILRLRRLTRSVSLVAMTMISARFPTVPQPTWAETRARVTIIWVPSGRSM